MPEPVFGVVLLNWNGIADTEAALDSLLAASPRPDHVVVVDNGSHDDSIERLQQWLTRNAAVIAAGAPVGGERPREPWLTVIAEAENHGFARGNNIGLTQLAASTHATHFLLLNNDATVAPDYFARMTDALRDFPGAGLLGCVIYHHPDRDSIWFGGGYEVPYRALMLHRYELPEQQTPHPTVFVTGCAMLIARPLYDARGGLAECYTPVYWEDTEYSFRARNSGWRVMLVPAARVYHKVGATVGSEKTTPKVVFWQNRHRGYYVRRNYKGIDRVMAIAYLIVTKPGRSLVELLRGRPRMGSAIFRGFVHGLIDDVA
ncbi:MAG: glycosyltransferase family 2 protein [Gemmatimonadaceae bacterium]